MKSIFLFLLISLIAGFQLCLAQRVDNVYAEQKEQKIYIYYNLVTDDRTSSFEIEAYCSLGNYDDELLLRSVSGDVGKGVKAGRQKMIVWDVLKDVSTLEGEDISFLVRAKPEAKPSVGYLRGEKEPTPQKVEMVYVEGGNFMMGSRKGKGNEQPEHQVFLDDFYISKYEITNAQYVDFLNDIGWENAREYLDLRSRENRIKEKSRFFSVEAGFEDYPVTNISWLGAQAYCEWIGGRLPTEAEWEYASKGGKYSKNYRYSGGNNYKDIGWSKRNTRRGIQPVGKKLPNELGLYDMSGNLWEWVYDVYDKDYYRKSPSHNPKGPSKDGYRVLRGGSYEVDSWYMRPSYRLRLNPETKTNVLGCRCAR